MNKTNTVEAKFKRKSFRNILVMAHTVQDSVWFTISFHSFVFFLCVFITEAPRLVAPAINTSPCIALSFLSFVLLSSRTATDTLTEPYQLPVTAWH